MKRITIDGEEFDLVPVVVEPIKTKLQEARERYPAGTKVIGLGGGVYEISKDTHLDEEKVCGVCLTSTGSAKVPVYMWRLQGVESWAEIVKEPLHPTIEDIYKSVKPVFWVDSDGVIEESSSYDKHKCIDSVVTKEDAEYILAIMQLINIANYYNAKYPSEKKDNVIIHDSEVYFNCTINIDSPDCNIKFTKSAAKEALSNPNVVEVLKKYFRIK